MNKQNIPQPIYYPILSTESDETKFNRSELPDIRVINMQEEFRFINDYSVPNIIPERYMISNYGRVYDRLYDQFVDFLPDQDNYPSFVVYYYADWNVINSTVVRVCEVLMRTFNLIPEYQVTPVRHLDGNRNHFRRNNLEWFDPDSLPDHLVETICSRLQSGSVMKQLSEAFDVPLDVIKDIRDGRRYNHIRRKYKIDRKRMNLLLPGQVREICQILEKNPNMDSAEIAQKMNCTVSAVNGIRSGDSYTRITRDYQFKRQKERSEKAKPLSVDDVREICEEFIRHPELNNYQIAMILGCKPTQVRDIRLRKVYKDIIKDYNW